MNFINMVVDSAHQRRSIADIRIEVGRCREGKAPEIASAKNECGNKRNRRLRIFRRGQNEKWFERASVPVREQGQIE